MRDVGRPRPSLPCTKQVEAIASWDSRSVNVHPDDRLEIKIFIKAKEKIVKDLPQWLEHKRPQSDPNLPSSLPKD